MSDVSTISNFRFRQTHELKYTNSYFKFESLLSKKDLVSKGLSKESCVYMWATPINDEKLDIIYIGKAGSGVSIRLKQHEAGFRNSGTGKKNLLALKELIDEGKRVFVYSRVSDKVTLFDVEVSQYSTEEEALIERLSPWLNRARMTKLNEVEKEQNRPLSTQWGEICGVDDLPHAEEVYYFLESLSDHDRKRFVKLFTWALKLNEVRDLQQKIVKGYTNHPPGYNGVPMLVFSQIGKKGRALPNSWRLRLTLDKVGVVLPQNYMKQSISEDKVFKMDKSNTFAPVYIDEFLDNPTEYTTLS
jgi:hypothetical protein